MPSPDGKRTAHLRWLRQELPTLVEQDVLDPAAAARLRDHYGLGELREPRNVALLAFGLLGALLVGGGVILIIAHNWDQLGRGVRAALALGLLLSSQLAAGYALLRHAGSAAWTESTALLVTLCLGASTALITQTYNVQGEPGDFMLSWLLLALPVFYLLRARVAAAVYLVLTLFLPETRQPLADFGLSFVPVAGAALPFVARQTAAHPDEARTRLLQWTASITLPVGLMMLLFGGASGDAEELALPLLGALFAAMHQLGAARVERGARSPGLAAPLSTCGLLGLLALTLTMTFGEPWPWESPASMARDLREPEVLVALALTVLLGALPSRAAVRALATRAFDRAALYALPAVAALGIALRASSGGELLPVLLGNAYALALGVALLSAGLSTRSLRRTNLGMAVLAALFVVRFLDMDLSMLARGVAMVVVGVAFAGVNVWLVRRTRPRPDTGPEDRP